MVKQNNPKFSIILATTFRDYPTAAKDRPRKLRRAINSVIQQTFQNWELLIICDGCPDSFEIAKEYSADTRIRGYLLAGQSLWSGIPRNVGKFRASGEWIVYLDNDDTYGPDHLKTISNNLKGDIDWVWFNDYRWHPVKQAWYENFCYIDKAGKHGTSNICYRRTLDVSWPTAGNYAHDYQFINVLRKDYPNYYRIATPGYYVCHIPDNIHGRGYDV